MIWITTEYLIALCVLLVASALWAGLIALRRRTVEAEFAPTYTPVQCYIIAGVLMLYICSLLGV